MTRCFLDRLPWNRRWRTEDYGRSLVAHAIDEARASGIKLVLLVGDEPYYGKLGFRRIPVGRITLPGPVDASRLLAAELVSGALDEYSGAVTHA